MSEFKVSNVRTGVQQENAGTENKAASPKSKSNQIEVIDDLGRKIVVKRLTALEKMRIAKIAGSDSSNAGYSIYITLAASVVSIDGEPEDFPMNIRAVEGLVTQLGDEGLDAVGKATIELNGLSSKQEGIEYAKN